MNKDNATNNAQIKTNTIEWFVPHFTPSFLHYAMLSEQILSKIPTDFQKVERLAFMKKENPQSFWTFELGTQEGINVPIWIIIGFQQRYRQGSQNLNKDTFYRPPVTSTHCIVGTENYLDSAILLSYDDDYYSQGYGQIKEVSRALSKEDILQSYISANDFRSSNFADGIGCNLHVFDIRYQKNLQSVEAINVEFKFSANFPAGMYGYNLVLIYKLVFIGSDGQRHFDLM